MSSWKINLWGCASILTWSHAQWKVINCVWVMFNGHISANFIWWALSMCNYIYVHVVPAVPPPLVRAFLRQEYDSVHPRLKVHCHCYSFVELKILKARWTVLFHIGLACLHGMPIKQPTRREHRCNCTQVTTSCPRHFAGVYQCLVSGKKDCR
jgi:hypothetical protein